MKYENINEVSHGFSQKIQNSEKVVYVMMTVKLYIFQVTSAASSGPLK